MELHQAIGNSARRRTLMAEIESLRNSQVITYFLSDRGGATAQIADDAVRPMYDHLRAMGRTERIDLYLYALGGLTEVPWRIVTMIREYAEHFSVIVPYRAMSAATMIALGADEIVIGPKGELGPIDPQMSFQRIGGETAVQEQIGVEDIMAFLRFAREQVGVTDQDGLASLVSELSNKLNPQILGAIYRAHSHIRDVAMKLLTSRSANSQDEATLESIVRVLAEQTYQHGHAIGRAEAESIGLPIHRPDEALSERIWELFNEYEVVCETRTPIDPITFLSNTEFERSTELTLGCIESTALAHHCQATFRARNTRQQPPQLNINLSLSVNLPQNLDVETLPLEVKQGLDQLLQQAQTQLQENVRSQIVDQMPIIGFEGRMEGTLWREVAEWVELRE